MKISIIVLFCAFSVFPLNRDGMTGVDRTLSAKTLRHGNLGVGFFGTVSTDARMIKDFHDPRTGTTQFFNESSLSSLSLYPFLSVGLSNFFDISAVLPVYWDDFTQYQGANQLQLGDFRYKFKAQIPYFSDRHIVDAAFFFGGALPTSQLGHGIIPREIEYFDTIPDAPGSSQYGYRKVSVNYGGGLTVDFGELNENVQIKWHNNIGMRKTFKTGVEPVLFYSTALEYRMTSFLSGYLEFAHEARFANLQTSTEFKTEPTVLGIGGALHTPIGIDMQMGLSFGLNSDHLPNVFRNDVNRYHYESQATAPITAWAGAHWRGWLIPQDDDKDGIVNSQDGCPREPEDKDKFKDLDGCPDPDNDEDGIPDISDTCPNNPEDQDGFADDDGCPDNDNDEDGIPDVKDGCPGVMEDLDGFEDADGCPEFDNDRDGVADSTDKCPMVAEDVDTFEDEDGCPDIDNDKDGIVDVKDKCPNQPENVNGFEDEDGCPDEKKKVEEVKNVTLQGVNFKTGSSELTFESFQVLDGVVEQLLAYPEVEIEIRGHTDNVGGARANQQLSESRAQSVVNYLMKKGVTSNRMKAIGYGESQPVAPNKSAEGRRQNRRIEMYRIK